ncbi:MAG: lytic transglycosylase domain-containing protein [Candidatus Magnetomorum sp.]|nr:lytic transglycosylase domain-containing protein [Candidatus Magnetomorum sp.]
MKIQTNIRIMYGIITLFICLPYYFFYLDSKIITVDDLKTDEVILADSSETNFQQKINCYIQTGKNHRNLPGQHQWFFTQDEIQHELLSVLKDWGEKSFIIDKELLRHVCYFFKCYTLKNRTSTNKTIIRSKKYLSRIISIFEKQKIPEDIAFAIPFVESRFNNNARSSLQAVGMFQFMKQTAREYGLHVSRHRDQRKDFTKAAAACARYIKNNQNVFASFILSLGSYHHGTGTVIKVLKTSDNRTYQSIFKSRYLGKYSKEYIPQCLAAALIYRFLKIKNLERIPQMTIISKKITTVTSIAKLTDQYPMIHLFNPDLKGVSKTYSYATTKGYILIRNITI